MRTHRPPRRPCGRRVAQVRRFYDDPALAAERGDTPICTFYARDGACRRGAKCKFAHVASAETRPSPEEVEAARAAAEADRQATAASSAGRRRSSGGGMGEEEDGEQGADGDSGLQRHFCPESASVRAARDADAFLQALGPGAARAETAAEAEERLAEERLEAEMAARQRESNPW